MQNITEANMVSKMQFEKSSCKIRSYYKNLVSLLLEIVDKYFINTELKSAIFKEFLTPFHDAR